MGEAEAPRSTAPRVSFVPAVYGIADSQTLGADRLVEAVATMATAGVQWIQVRIKGLQDDEWLECVRDCAALRRRLKFQLWVNDRPDLAALVAADGVHLGQSDLPPNAARTVVGTGCLIGVSCHDLEQVRTASMNADIDVIALGPVYPTRSKAEADAAVGLDAVAAARSITRKPLIAIGGIDARRLPEVLAHGADGAAIIGALCRGSIESNSRQLLERARRRE